MAAVQADLTDRTITHATTLLRLSAHEEQEVMRQMKRIERDLVRDLTRANLTSFRKDRYTRLLQQTRTTIRGHYKTIRDTQQEKMEEVARLESRWSVVSLNQAISEPVGIYLDLASVAWTAPQLKAIAGNAVIDGSPSKEWWARQAGDTQKRFATEVKQGLLRGETTETIIRTVRQSVLPVSHHQAEALVRSSISAVSHDARRVTYKQNEDLIRGIRHLSTLDNRTSPICIVYSNKMFDNERRPIGHDLPYKQGCPRHWNCRSTEVAILKAWSELAGRMLPGTDDKTVDEKFREKLRGMGWSEDRIAAARRRTQSSMDGQVPVELSFSDFLARKGQAFQEEVLGKGKADLYRRGLVSAGQLLDFRGNPLTLKQLRAQVGGI